MLSVLYVVRVLLQVPASLLSNELNAGDGALFADVSGQSVTPSRSSERVVAVKVNVVVFVYQLDKLHLRYLNSCYYNCDLGMFQSCMTSKY